MGGLVPAVGAIGVVLAVNPVVPGGQTFQRVIGKGVSHCPGAANGRQASVCGAIRVAFLIKRVPQLPGLAGQTVFAVIQMLCTLLNRAVVGLVAMNQTIQTVIFIVYHLPGGYVKLFAENSPVRAAGGLSLRL